MSARVRTATNGSPRGRKVGRGWMEYATTDGTSSACVDSATLRRAEPSDGLRSPSPPECSAAPAPARPTGRARHTRSASRPARAFRALAVCLLASAALLGSPAAASASADPPPSVNPSGVGGFRSIALSWQRVGAFPQIQRFQVRYSSTDIAAAVWTNIPGSDHNTTSYTVTGLADETAYAVRVRAVNVDGPGPYSELLVTTLAASADPPPEVVVTAVGGFRSATLSWNSLSGTQIQRFQVRYSRTNLVAAVWTNIPGSNHTTTSHTVTGLADETTYVMQIRAVNANGVGPNVSFAVVTTLAQTVAPSGFTVTGGFRKLDLAWTAAAATVAVDRYQHRLSTDGGDTWRRDWTDITGSDATTTSHTVGSLPDATTFTVELRIRAGTARSAAARATARTANLPTNFMGRPGAPANLTLTLSDGCYVTMDWSAPASNGGTTITRYQIRHRLGNRPFRDWQQDLGNPLTTELSSFFTCGVSHTYQFRAVNAAGPGPRAEITFTPRRSERPVAPRDLAAAGGFRSATLSWNSLSGTVPQIQRFQVRYSSTDLVAAVWTDIPGSNHTTTRHTVTGLADETTYVIQIRAVNSEGGGASAQGGATTLALSVDAPSGFTATAGIRKVDLAWTAAASTVPVEAYQYRRSTDGGDTWSRDWTDIAGSDATTTRHTLSRLANGTAYTVALRIRAGTARSAAASQSATTPDVPSAPGLRARPGDRRSIRLTWTRRYDGGRAITKYQYRRTRASPGFTHWATIPGSGPNTTSYTHSDGLSEGRKYTFEVRAVNAVGNGRARRVGGTTAVSGDPRKPTIRVWIALAQEGRDAAVDFTVELHPAASSTVTVDYRTEDRSATAPADYQATAGTLTFARGETAKTVSVPIVDDTVDDSGESFALLLSNVSGARLGVERAAGLIFNHEDVLAGFTLVDVAAGTDVGSLTDGTEVTLDAPATGQYGVRVETIPEAAIGSLRLALSGAKTVTRTDNAAPYTLYADGGEGLPPGAYTLQATAYADPDGGGSALQTRSVSFTVAEATADADDGASLSATFPASRFASTRHTGSDDQPQVVVTFSEAVAAFAANTPSVQVTGGTIRSVQAHTEDGLAHAWLFFLTPDGDGDVTFALVADAACTAGGLCTAGGTVLTEVPATLTIPGPEAAADDDADNDAEDDDDTDNADDTAPASLTAAFGEVPAEHDGQSAFNVRVEFSEDVGISYKALRDESFSVTSRGRGGSMAATICGRSRSSQIRARR